MSQLHDNTIGDLLGRTHLSHECLDQISVPLSIIELVPEAVARENTVLPLAVRAGILFVVVSNQDDHDLRQKLQFILNMPVQFLQAPRDAILAAIDRHYGKSETGSVDSALMEFTDTAIECTRMDKAPTAPAQTPAAPVPAPAGRAAQPAAVGPADDTVVDALPARKRASVPRLRLSATERQATIRYYQRMNPQRMFPLLVVLSRKEILEIVKRKVSQETSNAFQATVGSTVEIEPILPGCSCYPPREQVTVQAAETSTTFWVVPQVLGDVMQARVLVRQNGKILAEIPLQIRVVKQGLTVMLGALSLVLPFVLVMLKQYRLDFESQFRDGFGLYAQLINLILQYVSPEVLTLLLLLCTAVAYLWLRPRQRDVFWDVRTVSSERSTHD